MMDKTAICTIVSLNYFSQATNLSKSVKKYHADIDMYILIADKVDNAIKKKIQNNCKYNLIYLDDLQISNLYELAFKYDMMEFDTAIKPIFISFLFDKLQYQTVIYLDPDIQLFNGMQYLFEKLKKYSIVITPHLLQDVEGGPYELNEYLKHGIFNLGFIALNKSEDSQKLLQWWSEKLINYCYYDTDNGMAWDQKWMDFIIVLCDSVHVLKNPGYNVAFWNLHERKISKKGSEYYVNNVHKLIFYHFSRFCIDYSEFLVYYDDKNKVAFDISELVVKEIYEIYADNNLKMGYEYFSKIEYGFKRFNNGQLISSENRKRFREIKNKKDLLDWFDIKNIQEILDA